MMMKNKKEKLAIFDLDDTVIEINTTFQFIKFCLWRVNKLKYFLFILMEQTIIFFSRARAIAFLKGIPKNVILNLSDVFLDKIDKYLNKDILTKIQTFKNNGYKLVLISASLDFLVEGIAKKLNFNDCYGSEFIFIVEFESKI